MSSEWDRWSTVEFAPHAGPGYQPPPKAQPAVQEWQDDGRPPWNWFDTFLRRAVMAGVAVALWVLIFAAVFTTGLYAFLVGHV